MSEPKELEDSKLLSVRAAIAAAGGVKKLLLEMHEEMTQLRERSGMTLLSHTELLELVKQGVLRGVKPEAINGTSIDLHLHSRILVERSTIGGGINVVDLNAREPLDMNALTMDKDGYVLRPKEFILAATQETFYMPNNISAEYSLKSSLGRVGLDHMLAGWIDPGFNDSRLTLELCNMTRYHAHRIRTGDPIGQVKFFRHSEVPNHASYANVGRYNGDKFVQGIKK